MGILTHFPFDKTGQLSLIVHFNTELPYLLGSTNPYPITVDTEPFSASAFKDLTWIFATTTKICTEVDST